ncbi:MAG: hypothetical protein ACRDSJ_24200 [Rubrobacteraceae bacterium]
MGRDRQRNRSDMTRFSDKTLRQTGAVVDDFSERCVRARVTADYGAVWNGRPVRHGERVSVDEGLVPHFPKNLMPEARVV